MINPIVEEALANIIRRLDEIEFKISKLSIPDNKGFVKPAPINSLVATTGQKRYIISLGGVTPFNMTKQEAGKQIDMLLEQKEKKEKDVEIPEVNEPKEVDTDDAGIGEGDLL